MRSDTSIFVLLSGVEMWNVTPSKSDTTWSMFAGAPLFAVSCVLVDAAGQVAPVDPVPEERLDEHVLVVEEEHSGGLAAECRGAGAGGELWPARRCGGSGVRCGVAGGSG
jgi:hypothetical protein